MHRDGTVAKPPIALCEVQGYVYDAKFRMSSLMRSFGDVKTAGPPEEGSGRLGEALRSRVLGAESRLLRNGARCGKATAGSDCIECRAVAVHPDLLTRNEPARCGQPHVMRNDMFSGWGWRTMSQEEPGCSIRSATIAARCGRTTIR